MDTLNLSKRDGLDIVIGSDWSVYLTVEDDGVSVDYSGATFLCQIRNKVGGTIIATPAVTGDANGGITLSLAKAVTKELTTTATLPFESARYYYDIFVTKDSKTERLVEGMVEVSPAISKEVTA